MGLAVAQSLTNSLDQSFHIPFVPILFQRRYQSIAFFVMTERFDIDALREPPPTPATSVGFCVARRSFGSPIVILYNTTM